MTNCLDGESPLLSNGVPAWEMPACASDGDWLGGGVMFFFYCHTCKIWLEYPTCPNATDDQPHRVGEKTPFNRPPAGLLKKRIQTIDPTPGYTRKAEVNPVPPPSVANYQRRTQFGFNVTLKGSEEAVSNTNFWFKYNNELYEAIGSDKQDDDVTVDGLCKGGHGQRKQHIWNDRTAKHILQAAGYTVT